MPERLFYIDGEWRTYEQAHLYGFTKSKPVSLTFYTREIQPITLRKDVDTNTLYDLRETPPHEWVNDIVGLNPTLYRYIAKTTIYKGSDSTVTNGYSLSLSNNIITHVAYEGVIVPLDDLYNNEGITTTRSSYATFYEEDLTPVTFIKSSEGKYFDLDNHVWLDDIVDRTPTVFSYVRSVSLYKGDIPSSYEGYSTSANSTVVTHVNYNGTITSIDDLYYSDGITTTKSSFITYYHEDLSPVVLIKNSNDKFFDSENHEWKNDITEFDSVLYNYIDDIELYRGSDVTVHHGYSTSAFSEEITHTDYADIIVPLSDLYNDGITITPSEYVTYYHADLSTVVLIKNSDGKIFNNATHTWVNDITAFAPTLYNYVSDITLYRGDIGTQYRGFSLSAHSTTANYVEYEGAIVTIHSLYYSDGITTDRSSFVTFYHDDFSTVTLIKGSDNKLFDSDNHIWVYDINVFSPTLYNNLGPLTLYRAEAAVDCHDSFSLSMYDLEPSYVKLNNEMVTIRNLYQLRGITQYQCTTFFAKDGITLSWYDSIEKLYWDDRYGRKYWTSVQPKFEDQIEEANYIQEYPYDINPINQWEYDLSQMPITFKSYGDFEPTHATAELVTTFKDWPNFDVEQAPIEIPYNGIFERNYEPTFKYIHFDEFGQLFNGEYHSIFYTDSTTYDMTFYVVDPSGVNDYQDTHHDFGTTFTGDYENVMVDADAEVALYHGETKYIVGQSHDDNNPVLYYIDDKYMLAAGVHDLGYTFTEGENIEVWDSNLVLIDDNYIDLVVACKYDTSYADSVRPVKFSSDGAYWWAEVLTQEDKDKLVALDCFYEDTGYGFFGEVDYNPNYLYEVIQFYSDLGTTPVSLDVSNFYIVEREDVASIQCIAASNTTVKSYKLRIYYKESSTWPHPQCLYFANNGLSLPNIQIPDSQAVPMYYEDGTQVPYSDFDGLELVSLVNMVYSQNSSDIIEVPFDSAQSTKYKQFNNIGGYLYFMQKWGNPWGMIAISIDWKFSSNRYFYLQSSKVSKAFTANDYWWILQTKEYLDDIGLREDIDYIDTGWEGECHYQLLPSMYNRVSIIAVWTDACVDVTSNFHVSNSRTTTIRGTSTSVLTIDSSSSTTEIMGYVLHII